MRRDTFTICDKNPLRIIDFELKVMRIEHKYDATTSTSLKGADITIQTIKRLIEEGEKDARNQVIF